MERRRTAIIEEREEEEEEEGYRLNKSRVELLTR